MKKDSDPDLTVFALWTDRLVGDARWRWDAAGLVDERVRHYWDSENVAGTWLARNVPGADAGVWDSYFLFGPDAVWRDAPSPLLGSGSTVLAEGENLNRELSTTRHSAGIDD